ncbi:hypothetical protein [Arthrobacter sp. SO3]|nr:hypothetical protein [Arthrobacter sp. SO3]MCB5293710.1 hypothetical protein [Arthrobacter sp. SO3]
MVVGPGENNVLVPLQTRPSSTPSPRLGQAAKNSGPRTLTGWNPDYIENG